MEEARYDKARIWIKDAAALLQALPRNVCKKTGHQDLVSAQDQQLEEFFCRQIAKNFPADLVVGEELGGEAGSGYTWYIDPIDGTTNYLNQGRNFCISVACYREDSPVFGLVLDVWFKELYHARHGMGAFCNDIPIWASVEPELCNCLLYTPMIQHTFLQPHPRQAALVCLAEKVRAVRSLGSIALELCAVAAGRAELFVAIRSSPWDHNAAALILREAGGAVAPLDGTAFTVGYAGSLVACANPTLLNKVQECL